MEAKDGIIADLHIHSRFSRATSKNIDFDVVNLSAEDVTILN